MMPRTRSSTAKKLAILVSSDEEEDEAAPRTRFTRLKRRSAITEKTGSGSGVGRKRTRTTSLAESSRKTPDVELAEQSSPSSSTRAKLRAGGGGGVSLSFEEQCRTEIAELQAKYGEDDNGYGVKVSARHPITSVSVTISLLLDPQIRSFTLVLIDNPANPQSFKGSKFFPPIRVRLDISKNSTKLSLNASWLLKAHLKRLTKAMDEIFRQHRGSQPFSAALSWLEENGVKTAGIMHSRRVFYVAAAVDASKKQLHHIELQDLEPIRQLFLTTQYRRAAISKSPDLRNVSSFDCLICFEHKSVMMAAVFPSCCHHFCVDCVRQDWSLKVKENRIKEISCLAQSCLVPGSTEMVERLLDGEIFQRYCDLVADSVVEGSSFVRCPQKKCNAPMELARDARREVRCPTCKHKFCSTCKAKPHPKTPCLTDAQKKEIRDAYTKADAKGKKVLEARHGLTNIKFALEDAESADWIAKNAKPCPNCKTPIQKNDGCNKIVCPAKGCGAYFCWLCGEALKKPNPYLHFQSGPCSGRLHEGQNLNAAPVPGMNLHMPGFPMGLNGMLLHYWDNGGDSEDSDQEEVFLPGIPFDFEHSDSDSDDGWNVPPFFNPYHEFNLSDSEEEGAPDGWELFAPPLNPLNIPDQVAVFRGILDNSDEDSFSSFDEEDSDEGEIIFYEEG